MRLVQWLHSQVGWILVLGLLSWGLTGCYTQLQTTEEDPAAEASAEQTARTTTGAPTAADADRRAAAPSDPTGRAQRSTFDPAAPVASLRRADPDTTADLVSLAGDLQRARAYTEITFAEYREGVRFFRSNHPGFYGNYFGDPLYATYDAQYERTTQAALATSRALHPEMSFWRIDGYFCPPQSYDPAFGCRGRSFAASDFFFLPAPLAFRGTARAGLTAGPAFHRSFFTGRPWRGSSFGAGYGLFGARYGYGGWGTGLYMSALAGTSAGYGDIGYGDVDYSDHSRRDGRNVEPRGGTVGRGGASADGGPNRSGRRNASETRDRAARDVRSGGLGASLRTDALASVEDVALRPVRVPMPNIEDASREQKLRTFRALKRIAEETDGGMLSIEQDRISERIQRLVQARREDLSADRDGRSRARSPNAPNMGRKGQGGSGARGTRVGRGGSGSDGGASRSGGRDRSGSGSSGRDRSRSGSGDSGGR